MSAPVFLVVPSLKVTGGTKEIVTLARDMAALGADARVVAMWRTRDEVSCHPLPVIHLSPHAISPARALFGLPAVLARCRALTARHPGAHWVFSHYVTYALAPLVGQAARWFFVQDLEWMFVPRRARGPLRRLILLWLRRGRVLAANTYLRGALRAEGVAVAATVPIWAATAFRGDLEGPRDVDLVLMMRRGAHKRADLVRAVLAARAARHPDLRVAVVTPNDEFARDVGQAWGADGRVQVLLRPTPDAMRALYGRAAVFLLLSEHEGFGLPPLEAMGSGCVPLCRDAGGVRAYMEGELAANILPLSLGTDELIDRAAALARDPGRLAALRVAALRLFDGGLARAADRRVVITASGVLP